MPNLKCPHCGANVIYNLENESIECPYCLSKFNPKALEEDETIKAESEVILDGETYSEYLCTSCGAALVAEKDTSAFPCPYCGGTLLTQGLTGEFEPDGIIPFKVTREEFIKKYQEYTKKILVSSKFKKITDLKEQKGVYLPYNLYDSEIYGYFYFLCEEDETEEVEDSDGNRHTETRTETTYEYGMSHIVVENLPIGATVKIDHKYTDAIQPFDFSEYKAFSPSYIAGFTAEKKNDTEENLSIEAIKRIKKSSELEAMPASYDRVVALKASYDMKSINKKYCLLPAWSFHVTYKGKEYFFLCNGQTGKMGGQLPISVLRCIMLGLSIYLGVLIIPFIFFLIYHNFFIIGVPAFMGLLPTAVVLLINILNMRQKKRTTASSSVSFRKRNEISDNEIEKILDNTTNDK